MNKQEIIDKLKALGCLDPNGYMQMYRVNDCVNDGKFSKAWYNATSLAKEAAKTFGVKEREVWDAIYDYDVNGDNFDRLSDIMTKPYGNIVTNVEDFEESIILSSHTFSTAHVNKLKLTVNTLFVAPIAAFNTDIDELILDLDDCLLSKTAFYAGWIGKLTINCTNNTVFTPATFYNVDGLEEIEINSLPIMYEQSAPIFTGCNDIKKVFINCDCDVDKVKKVFFNNNCDGIQFIVNGQLVEAIPSDLMRAYKNDDYLGHEGKYGQGGQISVDLDKSEYEEITPKEAKELIKTDPTSIRVVFDGDLVAFDENGKVTSNVYRHKGKDYSASKGSEFHGKNDNRDFFYFTPTRIFNYADKIYKVKEVDNPKFGKERNEFSKYAPLIEQKYFDELINSLSEDVSDELLDDLYRAYDYAENTGDSNARGLQSTLVNNIQTAILNDNYGEDDKKECKKFLNAMTNFRDNKDLMTKYLDAKIRAMGIIDQINQKKAEIAEKQAMIKNMQSPSYRSQRVLEIVDRINEIEEKMSKEVEYIDESMYNIEDSILKKREADKKIKELEDDYKKCLEVIKRI